MFLSVVLVFFGVVLVLLGVALVFLGVMWCQCPLGGLDVSSNGFSWENHVGEEASVFRPAFQKGLCFLGKATREKTTIGSGRRS